MRDIRGSEPKVHLINETWVALERAYDLHVHAAPDVIAKGMDDVNRAGEPQLTAHAILRRIRTM